MPRITLFGQCFKRKSKAKLVSVVLTGLLGARAQAEPAQYLPLFLGQPPAVQLSGELPVCPPPQTALEKTVWQTVQRYQGTQAPDLSCGNRFEGLLRLPQSETNPDDAFTRMFRQIREAHSEVLIANMALEARAGEPGWDLAHALKDLYRKVSEHPEQYPHGMTVKLSLGGVPQPLTPYERPSLQFVADLRALGVPLQDPRSGWQLAVANYRYFPHSHVKLQVIDGRTVTVGGYNISAWHLPEAQPRGHNLHDLGLEFSGPAARGGVQVFDDLWLKSRLLVCPPIGEPLAVTRECRWQDIKAKQVAHPGVTLSAEPLGPDRAWVLYRRPGYQLANDALLALIAASQHEIELMQVDFSGRLSCVLAYSAMNQCQLSSLPVYMQELLRAMQRGVKVKVLAGAQREAALPNRSAIALLRQETRRLGIEDRLEVRYSRFNMHSKASVFDREMLVVGSLNYHFSSWGKFGLNEAVLVASSPSAVQEQRRSFEEIWSSEALSRPVPPEPWLRDVQRAR